MNKRDTVLSLAHSQSTPAYVPAAFFMHFDRVYQQGQAAIDKHLEFFRTTGMDFVKIQYEQPFPASTPACRGAPTPPARRKAAPTCPAWNRIRRRRRSE